MRKAFAAAAIDGTARDVAALCAREAVKGFLEKAKAQEPQAEASSGEHEREVAAACARVVVARYVEKASLEVKTAKLVCSEGPGREEAAACARVAVASWTAKASEAARREGPEGKVAAACARVAVARYVEKAKEAVRSQGESQEKAERDRVPEFVKRHEGKAFEEALAQGDERQVAALCARYAVKQFVAQASDVVRQQGTPPASVQSTVEKVHSSVVKAANHLAAAAQATVENLEGLVSDCEDPANANSEEGVESPRGTRSPMKPDGVAPKKKRPAPKLKGAGPTHVPLAQMEPWTAPPSPQTLLAELALPPPKKEKAQAKIRPYDVEEERKRDVELLQQRHQENLQRQRQVQQELRTQHQQSFVRDVSGQTSLAPQGSSRDWRPRVSAEPQPPKPKKGRAGVRASSSRQSRFKPSEAETTCTLSASDWAISKDAAALPENLLAALAEMEADVPRSVVDDPVLRAYLAVYKSTVCKRGGEDDDTRGAGELALPEGQSPCGSRDGSKRRAKSAASRLSKAKGAAWLQPGLMSWQDRGKAWFWPRKGAVPPMETAVLALLNGQPPPIEATAQAAAAARQQFALYHGSILVGTWSFWLLFITCHQLVGVSELVSTTSELNMVLSNLRVSPATVGQWMLTSASKERHILCPEDVVKLFTVRTSQSFCLRLAQGVLAKFDRVWFNEYLVRTINNQSYAIRQKTKDDILVSWRYLCERSRAVELEGRNHVLVTRVNDLEAKMVATQEDLEEAARQWEEQRSALEADRDEYKRLYEKFLAAHERAMAELEESQGTAEDQAKKLQVLTLEKHRLTDKVEELEDDKKRMSKQLAELRDEVAKLKAELRRLGAQLREGEVALLLARSDAQQLRADARSLEDVVPLESDGPARPSQRRLLQESGRREAELLDLLLAAETTADARLKRLLELEGPGNEPDAEEEPAGMKPASEIGVLPAERRLRRHVEKERDELLTFARDLDTELVKVKTECYHTVREIKQKCAQELEDFKTTELAKVKADFQAKIDEITRQRDMLQKEVELGESVAPHLPTLNPLVSQDPSRICGVCRRTIVFEGALKVYPQKIRQVKKGLPAMLKGGVLVIMDVMNKEQAKIAEEAGACAVMALERIPADIRQSKGVARMSDPKMIKEIVNSVSIPVMAKCRIGHFVESQVLQQIGVDCIDESEVLTVADEGNHVNKTKFKVPFVCGCRNLGEALRRIAEGASMIRTKGEAGTGDVVEAVRHIRTLHKEMRMVQMMDDDELFTYAKEIGAPIDLLQQVKKTGKLPVVNFAAGGVATPADAALCMQLGVDGVFVGSGIFKSSDPAKRARAIVKAVTHYNDPQVVAEVSEDLGEAMTGINCDGLVTRFADREGGNMPAAKKARMESYGDHKGLAGTAF
ncbi:pdx1 [Symbiodinium sp. CCMP2592]|nr:pdx1 [Symbiodinium sp. CCMP2592]